VRHGLDCTAQTENAECDESRLRPQRRTVEGAGMRLGSLSGGAVSSQERFSTKRRRIAWLRATRLKWGVGQGESREEADRHTAVLAFTAA